MAQTIKLKRSATTGNAPTTSQLALGELGINTTDGKLFLKKSVSGTESIVEVGGLPLSGGSLTGNISLGDNVKAQFGASNDLQLYHTGSNSYIKDAGTGALIQLTNSWNLNNAADTQNMITATEGGAARLFYSGAGKIATTSTGIDVTGSVVADGLTVDGNPVINGTSPQLFFQTGSSHANWQIAAQENVSNAFEISSGANDASAPNDTYTKRLVVQNNGDISFYNDSAAQGLFWDSSTSRLGLGTTVPQRPLHLDIGTNNTAARFQSTDTEVALEFIDTAGTAYFRASGDYIKMGATQSDTLTINADGSSVFSGAVSATSGNYTTSGTASLADGTNGLRIVREGGDGAGALGNGITFAQRWWSNSTQNVRTGAIFGKKINGSGSYGGGLAFYSQPASGADMVEALSIDSSQRVNIGSSLMVGATTAPEKPVHIKSADIQPLRVESTSAYSGIELKNNTSSTLPPLISSLSDGFLVYSGHASTRSLLLNLSSSGATFSGSVSTGNMTLSGQEIDVSSGDLTLDVAGNINLDADGANVYFNDGGTERYRFKLDATPEINVTGGTFTFKNNTSDADILFSGNDGGSAITALTLDMSNAGAATFNSTVTTNKLTLTKDPVGTYSIEVDGTNTGQPNLIVKQSTSERFRCDNNGNLLVGTTDTDPSNNGAGGDAGHAIAGTGYIASARSGDTVALFNRMDNDGNIVDFRKDGAVVGSIGASGGDLVIGTGDTGIHFHDGVDSFIPWNVSAASYRDAAIDLGTSTYRFKDLYLSGNITMGSTAQINASNAFYLDSDIIHFRRNNEQESARIDSSGNLLVGSSSTPSGSTDGTVIFASGTIASYRTGAAPAVFSRNASNGGEVVVIQQQGTTVGSIGTTGGKLEIDGPSNNSGLRFHESSLIPRKNGDVTNGQVDLGYNDGSIILGFRNLTLSNAIKASTLKFENSAGTTEYARFDSSNNLLVGTTGANTYSSTVNTGVQIAPDFIGVARNQNTVMHLNRQGNDGTIVDFRTFGFVRGSVSISGSTTSYNTSSDERLKDNIIDAPIASEDIDAIQVRSFDWKADGEHQKYGMVAQELLEVAPDAVTQGDTPDDMMGVDYSKLVPMLIKEIQSLRQRVAQLEE